MIRAFSGKTADDVWRQAISSFKNYSDCTIQQSRLGVMQEILHANFYIENPRERWVVSRVPAINPAFAIAEVFWILAGSNDSAFINFWNPSLPKYAGNSDTYHGAYGYRIINQFGINQLERAFYALKNNPDSRQVVIQLWDASNDFPDESGKPVSADIPCNLFSMPKVRNGKLEWTQVMRSNDLYRGTPYNIVQFTTLQEIMAGWLGLEIGGYYQVSDSLHVYESDAQELKCQQPQVSCRNNDILSIDKDRYDALFGRLWSYLCELSALNLTINRFNKLINDVNIPKAYENLLLIAAADSARRRGWYDEMELAIEKCTNPLLVSLINAWIVRWSKMQKIIN